MVIEATIPHVGVDHDAQSMAECAKRAVVPQASDLLTPSDFTSVWTRATDRPDAQSTTARVNKSRCRFRLLVVNADPDALDHRMDPHAAALRGNMVTSVAEFGTGGRAARLRAARSAHHRREARLPQRHSSRASRTGRPSAHAGDRRPYRR